MSEPRRILRGMPLHADPRRLLREPPSRTAAAPTGQPQALPVMSPDALPPAQQAERDAAYAEGYRAGLEAGRAAAALQAAALAREATEGAQAHEADRAATQQALAEVSRLEDRLARERDLLAGLIGRWPAEMEAMLADAEDDLVEIAFELAGKVLGEHAASLEGLRAQLRIALKAWHGRAALGIHLHPHDLALLQHDSATLDMLRGAGFSGHRHTLRWVADPAVQLGGLMLRSSEGLLDARLEVQLDALKAVLVATRSARKLAPPAPPRKEAA